MKNVSEQLKSWNACSEKFEWAKDLTWEQMYLTCERGDWLLWLAGKCEIDHKLLVSSACDCAETVVHLASSKSRKLLSVIREWVEGKATIKEVKIAAAADAVYDAAAADAAADVVAAAYAAVDAAAYAVYDAVYDAANAAAYAAYAAAYAAAADVVAANQKQCADLVRKNIPFELFSKSLS